MHKTSYTARTDLCLYNPSSPTSFGGVLKGGGGTQECVFGVCSTKWDDDDVGRFSDDVGRFSDD